MVNGLAHTPLVGLFRSRKLQTKPETFSLSKTDGLFGIYSNTYVFQLASCITFEKAVPHRDRDPILSCQHAS